MSRWLSRALAGADAPEPAPGTFGTFGILAQEENQKPPQTALKTRSEGGFDTFGTFGTQEEGERTALPERPQGHLDTFGTTGVPKVGPVPATVSEVGRHPLADEWATGFKNLSPIHPPCPGIPRWHLTHRAIRRFLAEHGDRAAELGWGTLDLFGVHPVGGNIRGDCSGVLTAGLLVTEVLPDKIRLGHLTCPRHPCPGARVAMWDFRT